LADKAIKDYEPLDFDFPDENVLLIEEKNDRLVDHVFWYGSKYIW